MVPQKRRFLDAPQPMVHCQAGPLVMDAYLERVFDAGQKLTESELLRRFIRSGAIQSGGRGCVPWTPVSLSFQIPDTQEVSWTPVSHSCTVKYDAVGCLYFFNGLVPPFPQHHRYINSMPTSRLLHSFMAGRESPASCP